jgi:hypothetical protein
MQDAVSGVLGNLERVLRWVYPGILFMALWYLGRCSTIESSLAMGCTAYHISNLGLAAAIAVSSPVIYMLQRYVLHEMFVQYGLFLLRRGDAFNYARSSPGRGIATVGFRPGVCGWWLRLRSCFARRCPRYGIGLSPCAFWEWSSQLQVASLNLMEGRYNDYRSYTWAVTHFMGMLCWLLPLGRRLALENSFLESFSWRCIWVTVAVLSIVWLWQELRNVAPPIWARPQEIRRLGQH